MSGFSDLLCIRFLKKDILAEDIKNQARPRARMINAQLLSDFAELLEWNLLLVAQYRDNPQADQVFERVDSAKCASRIFRWVIWREKPGIVPVRELTQRESSEAAHVKRAEGSNYACHGFEF